jgi:hypothetical protein
MSTDDATTAFVGTLLPFIIPSSRLDAKFRAQLVAHSVKLLNPCSSSRLRFVPLFMQWFLTGSCSVPECAVLQTKTPTTK